jgi:hypothetical protein
VRFDLRALIDGQPFGEDAQDRADDGRRALGLNPGGNGRVEKLPACAGRCAVKCAL